VATGGAGFFRPLGEVFLPRFDDFGVFDALFTFELGFEKTQEVMDDAHGDGLNALALLAGAPSSKLWVRRVYAPAGRRLFRCYAAEVLLVLAFEGW